MIVTCVIVNAARFADFPCIDLERFKRIFE